MMSQVGQMPGSFMDGLGHFRPRGGGYSQCMWRGGLTELHIVNPKRYVSLKFDTWHQNFLPQKIKDLNTSILIYSTKQNLRPKKICGTGFSGSGFSFEARGQMFRPVVSHSMSDTFDSSIFEFFFIFLLLIIFLFYLKCYEVKKLFCLIWKAFKREDEWCFPFCNAFFRSRDIQVLHYAN